MEGLSLEMWQEWPVYGPETGEDLPGVVILHGSEGPMAGWAHRFAAILAAQGVLALPYSYGEGDFWGAGVIGDVPLEPVLDAVAHLAAHPRCRGAGVFGWSMGAEMALVLASIVRSAARLPFVAAHAPSDIVHGAFDPARMRAGGDWRRLDPEGPRAWHWPQHAEQLAPGSSIDIECYRGPVFLSVGMADEIRDPAMTERLAARLEAAGRPADLFIAEGQGHGFDFDREPELWARLLRFVGGGV